jgi:sarcosine oxidase subunit beta
MNRYDVIVVGAGSVGVPSAYFLAQKGLKVLVLDKRASVGQGENKAAIGGARATHSDPAKILICLDSLEVFSTWEERYGVSIEWKPGGYCFPVFDEETEALLKGILPIQKSYGLAIDWVGPEVIAKVVPGIVRENLRGGTYSPGDGQVSPLRAAVAFQRAARDLGAEFHFNEEVIGYQIASGTIAGIVTTRGTYSCGAVVLAAGSDAGQHSEWLGIDIPVVPDSHEAGISAAVEPCLEPLVVDLRPGPYGKTANFYFGQKQEGQFIFCYTPREPFLGQDRESQSEFLPILARRMVDLIPRLRNLLIRRIWRGCYPMTPDGVPIVDNIESVKGLTLAVGMCGQGFMMGPGVGRNVASLVTEGKPLLPPEVHGTLRFDRDFYAAKKEALK